MAYCSIREAFEVDCKMQALVANCEGIESMLDGDADPDLELVYVWNSMQELSAEHHEQPFGITCKENLVKECEEEAGIPRFIAEKATSVGAVSYMDIEGYRFKRDVLFCYDLELSSDFVPKNEDGEVDSFKLIPVVHVANIVRRTEFFKPNCSLVIMDFLFRHGFIGPHDFGYLSLLHSLRSGNCS